MSNANAREDLEEGSTPPPSHGDGVDDDNRTSTASVPPPPDGNNDEDDANPHASSLIPPSSLHSPLQLSLPSPTPSQGDDDATLASNGAAPLLSPPSYDTEDNRHEIMSPHRASRSSSFLYRYGRILAVLALALLAALVVAVAIGFAAPDVSPVQTEEWAGDSGGAPPRPPEFDVILPPAPPSPTNSPAPSSSPTTCARRMASEGAARRLELPVDRPYDSQVAVEGRHAVVVARDAGTTDVHVIFYVLLDVEEEDGGGKGTWERGNHYVIDYGETYTETPPEVDPLFTRVSVALSGTSALVGLPYSHSYNYTVYPGSPASPGEVLIFERIEGTEIWEKKDARLLPLNETGPYYYFGASIDVVGDMACVVSDYSPDGTFGEPKVYVFRRVEGQWEQIRRLDLNYPPSAKECFVGDEDTLAVQVDDRKVEIYKYDQFDGNYLMIQDPIEDYQMESVSFDNDYLVYSTNDYDCPRRFYVYRRRETYQPYILQQSVNITNSSACSPPTMWPTSERFTLPTYSPTITPKPRPTYSPTITPKPTTSPRPTNPPVTGPTFPPVTWPTYQPGTDPLGTTPTEEAREERRELFHIVRTGFEASIFHDGDLLVTRGDNRTDVYVKRQDDGYWEWALALGRPYRGYHASGRRLLATAYNTSTEEDEMYYFDVEDCEPSPTHMPSLSQAPTSSTYPSPVPTVTGTFGYTPVGGGIWKTLIPTEGDYRCEDPWFDAPPSTSKSPLSSPTETCYWIDITIAFDDEPSSISWDVQRVNDSGDNKVLMISKGGADDAYQLRDESICVEEGLYQFTIYGKGGIRYPGYYNVTSYGDLIARGGKFDCSENVTFPIPLTAAPSTMPSETLLRA